MIAEDSVHGPCFRTTTVRSSLPTMPQPVQVSREVDGLAPDACHWPLMVRAASQISPPKLFLCPLINLQFICHSVLSPAAISTGCRIELRFCPWLWEFYSRCQAPSPGTTSELHQILSAGAAGNNHIPHLTAEEFRETPVLPSFPCRAF